MKSVEERLRSVELAVSQLNRRMTSRRILAPLTPVVFSDYVKKPIDGLIRGILIPVSGYITYVSAFVEKLPIRADGKPGFTLIVFFESPDGVSGSKSFDIRMQKFDAMTSIFVKAGSRISVTTPSEIEGAWYGVIFEPETVVRFEKIDVSTDQEDLDSLAPVEREILELPE